MDARTFTDSHGVEIAYYVWTPGGAAKAVVLIAHGASEHGARYDRFATFLRDQGFAVYAQDHRGHGNTAKVTGVGIAGPGGWQGLVDDQHELNQLARGEVPGVPVILFAHSMGSFMTQAYLQTYSGEIDGVVLSGSMGGMENISGTVELLDAVIAAGNADDPAPSLSTFNDQFPDARTPFDWLSRDPAEVDKYIADPFCGDNHPLTLGYMRDMLSLLSDTWAEGPKLRPDLPVLFITGEMDPVSQNAMTVRQLEQRYRDGGVTDVTGLYYPEARHELLNETNRDDVQRDVLAWIERVTA